MKTIILILLLCSQSLFSQKEISHIIGVDAELKTIYFTLNSVYDISIRTTQKQEISIIAFSEGEYANYFSINETRTTSTLNIKGDTTFIFPNFQDKLSVHKQHVISVVIWVPEKLNVILQSDIGNVKASGTYKSLITDSDSGNCFLKAVKGSITASSVSGAIYLSAKNGSVTTQSNTGSVVLADLPKGTTTYHLKTNKGNITVTKI